LLKVRKYLASDAAKHVQARLHCAAAFLGMDDSEGECMPPKMGHSHESGVLKIQDAFTSDLLVLPQQMMDTMHSTGVPDCDEDAQFQCKAELLCPMKMVFDFEVEGMLKAFYHVPWAADCPTRGWHDFKVMESALVSRVFVARRPLQVCSREHKEFASDIATFPYRLYHGNLSVTTLRGAVSCQLAPQVSLKEAVGTRKAEDLEQAFYRDAAYAEEAGRISGDLIPLLLGCRQAGSAVHGDMTLQALVQVCVRDGLELGAQAVVHPDALARIVRHTEISAVPLRGIVALHLLCRDIVAMVRGVSIKTQDAGLEYTAFARLPEGWNQGIDDERTVALMARLLARCLYLAYEKPWTHQDPEGSEPQRLSSMVCEMDLFGELATCAHVAGNSAAQCHVLHEDLLHWSARHEGHTVVLFREYRQRWRATRGKWLEPKVVAVGRAMDQAFQRAIVMAPCNSQRGPRSTGKAPVQIMEQEEEDESEEEEEQEEQIPRARRGLFGR